MNPIVRTLAIALCLLVGRSASAAIVVDANVSRDQATASTSTSTAAFSTTAGNELLLAFVSADYSSGVNTKVNSVTGAGLTWALVVRTNAQSGTAEIWRAFAPSPLISASVTVTFSQSAASSLTVVSFTGVDTSGTNGSGAIGATGSGSAASGAPTATLVTTRANSWVFGVGTDWDRPVARTPGSGQSLVHQFFPTAGDTYWVQKQNSVTPVAGTTVAINDTAPTTDRYDLSICEILPALAGPPATWSLSGTIAPAANGSGSTVTLSGASSATATADGSGGYSFNGLSNGTYTVTPSKSGFTFTPSSRSATIDGANVAAIDFTAQATAPPTAIQLVQSNVNGSETGVFNISASFPSNNTAGNFLIVTGTAARPAGTITIADTAGNTYVPAIGPVSDPAQDVTAYIWYVPNCRGGANTVTLTPTSARPMEIHISEWSGLSPTSPLDQTAAATGFGTAVSSGSRTTTTNGELIFGYSFVVNNGTPGAGFTQIRYVNGDLDEYQIQAAAGSVAATFTQASGDWLALMATFKPAGPPDTTAPTVSVAAPVDGAAVFGTTTVTADATDNVGVAGVQLRIDGSDLGAELTTPPYSRAWNTTTVADGSHTVTAIARDAAGNKTTSSPVTVTVGNTSNPAVVGQWGTPFNIGMVAVNMIMMHTGKVLMMAGTFASSWPEQVWDPATGNITLVPNPYYNVFCAGHSQLADGRILVVGGYDPPSWGAYNANIFDPVTQTWSALPNMTYRRWYPTSTTLPDGRALVTSGAQSCLTCLADVPEIFDPATNQFTALSTARLGVPYYPFMFLLPDGKVVDAGANENPVATSKLDLTTRAWSTVDPIVRDGHSAAMYQTGKILKSGTAADSGTTGNAAATAYVIDMNQPSPAWRPVASMANPRAFHNTTLLPDGTVLVTGGGTALDGYDVTKSVKMAELWSPTTETWKNLSSAAIPRLYHSTALLLPDGRVLTAGSGDDGPAVNQLQAEIFSPPYLFKGARPTITGAPDLIQYGAPFTVQTADAATIGSVALIRPGAVTHAFDEDQRFLNLSFTAASGSLTIQAPASANLAPPGYYMLFLVNNAGVPSIAAFVHFAAPTVDTEPPTSPLNLSGQGTVGSAALTWTASTDNTGVALYNVHRSTTSGFVPSTANRIGQATTTSFTDSGVAAGTYYYVVTAQDVAGNVSQPSNEASVIVLADSTPPTVAIITPSQGATVTGSISVAANASDDVAVAGVQFQLDGQALGAERTSTPYSVTWNTTTASNATHTLTAVARDTTGNSAQASVDVTVSNTGQNPSGLVAAFGFNEGSGVQTHDASGQGNTGTISSATWTTAGKYGNALSFNGTSAWVTVADAASLDLTNGMTIEAWVNPTSNAGWRTIVLKEKYGGLAYSLYSANGSARPAGYVYTTSEVGLAGTAALPLNTWAHLAVTFDGTTMRMFVNGVQVSTRALTESIVVSDQPLRIGGNALVGEYYIGMIDEVRIYNRALTAAEIQSDMTTPIP